MVIFTINHLKEKRDPRGHNMYTYKILLYQPSDKGLIALLVTKDWLVYISNDANIHK